MNRWDERYSKRETSDQPPESLLTDAVEGCPPGQALDLACGTGRHAIWLAARGWHVAAIDYSAVALNILRERASEAGLDIHTRLADLEDGSFIIEPETYDLICDICFLHRPLFEHIRKGLRPGGLFVGLFPLEGSAMNPAYLMKAGELPAHFEGWQILQSFERMQDRPRAALVARKPVTARG